MLFFKNLRFLLFFLLLTIISSKSYSSSSNEVSLKDIKWKFDGIFGSHDYASIQRGFQVYREVCSTCHSLNLVSYRNLAEIGFTADEIKQLAAEKTVIDGPNDNGEMFTRRALPSDKIVPPFANEKAARVANNGAYPPDLSLIIKARMNGADYVYSILTGYVDPPKDFTVGEGMNYNPYFANKQIAMSAPLQEGLIEYIDKSPASVDQMARDVVNFLQWAAEPEMAKRKNMGIRAMIFLIILTILFIVAKKRVWRNVK